MADASQDKVDWKQFIIDAAETSKTEDRFYFDGDVVRSGVRHIHQDNGSIRTVPDFAVATVSSDLPEAMRTWILEAMTAQWDLRTLSQAAMPLAARLLHPTATVSMLDVGPLVDALDATVGREALQASSAKIDEHYGAADDDPLTLHDEINRLKARVAELEAQPNETPAP